MTETQETPAIKADSGGEGVTGVDEGTDGAIERGESSPQVLKNGSEPSHHARRPMNAFLIFCKRHRSVVRDKYPNLENRSITKILGEWWANLEKDEKACYTGLAKQYKDAFFTAHPDFKWYKLPAPPLRTFSTRPGNVGPPDQDMFVDGEMCEVKVEQTNNNHLTKVNYNAQPSTSTSKEPYDGKRQIFTPGKLADEAHMGGLSSLIIANDKLTGDESNYNLHPSLTSVNAPHLETPKYQPIATVIPNYPKKCPFSESDNNDDRHKFYRREDISPPSKNDLSPAQKKLQDTLSETSRVFELSFDSSNEMSCSDSAAKSYVPENTNRFYGKDSSFVPSSSLLMDDCSSDQKTFLKFSPKPERNSLSSDESQDRESQQIDDMNLFDKNKSSWSHYGEQSQMKVSGRACKGKRYLEFMAYGGLIVNKRQKKDHTERKASHLDNQNKLSYEVNSPTCSWKMFDNYPKESSSVSGEGNDKDLESEFAYRERMEISDCAYKYKSDTDDTGQPAYRDVEHGAQQTEPTDSQGNKMFTADDFHLDAKIMALPSLSLEKFQQKKKENKKRKKNVSSLKHKESKPRLQKIPHYPPDNIAVASFGGVSVLGNNRFRQTDSDLLPMRDLHQNITNDERMMLAEQRKTTIIGSKKRKPRKISITRLDINNCKDTTDNAKCSKLYNPDPSPTSMQLPDQNTNDNVDLCALATLAEVAANTSKINEDA